jgi:hypothetical protein
MVDVGNRSPAGVLAAYALSHARMVASETRINDGGRRMTCAALPAWGAWNGLGGRSAARARQGPHWSEIRSPVLEGMALLPKTLSNLQCIDLQVLPPRGFVAGLMQLSMMAAAER